MCRSRGQSAPTWFGDRDLAYLSAARPQAACDGASLPSTRQRRLSVKPGTEFSMTRPVKNSPRSRDGQLWFAEQGPFDPDHCHRCWRRPRGTLSSTAQAVRRS